MISVAGLHALSEALARLDLSGAQRDALVKAAGQLETAVRQLLSRRPGEDHSTPWYQTGALHDSIGNTATDTKAVIGSTDAAAIYGELGTRSAPPRPFLAAAASEGAEEAAREVAGDVVGALKEALP